MFNIDEIYTVTNFLKLCRNSIEKNVPHCFIQGEISNLSKPSSGHWYISLKDSNGQIRCAFFRLNQRKVQFNPENGMSVIIRGAPTLYEQRKQDEYRQIRLLDKKYLGLFVEEFEKLIRA